MGTLLHQRYGGHGRPEADRYVRRRGAPLHGGERSVPFRAGAESRSGMCDSDFRTGTGVARSGRPRSEGCRYRGSESGRRAGYLPRDPQSGLVGRSARPSRGRIRREVTCGARTDPRRSSRKTPTGMLVSITLPDTDLADFPVFISSSAGPAGATARRGRSLPRPRPQVSAVDTSMRQSLRGLHRYRSTFDLLARCASSGQCFVREDDADGQGSSQADHGIDCGIESRGERTGGHHREQLRDCQRTKWWWWRWQLRRAGAGDREPRTTLPDRHPTRPHPHHTEPRL